MNLKINPRHRTPIYQQIVQAIKQQVAVGELKAGQQLPTIRALADQMHIHANTVARAYDLLDQSGVISMQQGRGTYITEQPDRAEMQQHRHAELNKLIGYTLLEALSLGYSHAEIEAAFAENLKHWRRERHSHGQK
jgi:GntR family transcriptional regulator